MNDLANPLLLSAAPPVVCRRKQRLLLSTAPTPLRRHEQRLPLSKLTPLQAKEEQGPGHSGRTRTKIQPPRFSQPNQTIQTFAEQRTGPAVEHPYSTARCNVFLDPGDVDF
jgi:hypothetical protein